MSRKFKVGDRVVHAVYPCVGVVTGFDWTHVLVKWDSDNNAPVESVLPEDITHEVPEQ